MSEYQKAISGLSPKERQDLHRMDIPGTPVSLTQMLSILCWETENLPPSDQQTKVSALICELRDEITRMQSDIAEFIKKKDVETNAIAWATKKAETQEDICPDCEGAGEVAGDRFSEDSMTTCNRCGGKGILGV